MDIDGDKKFGKTCDERAGQNTGDQLENGSILEQNTGDRILEINWKMIVFCKCGFHQRNDRAFSS